MPDPTPTSAAVPASVTRALRRHGYRGELAFEPLAGDVGQRRYLRPRGEKLGGPPVLVALYPPSLVAAGRRFRITGDLLAAVGVRVPEVLEAGELPGDGPEDAGWGAWMLVEDLGPATLWQQHGRRHRGSAAAAGAPPPAALVEHFRRAARLVERIRSLPVQAVRALSPSLDRALLARELEGTWRSFLGPRGMTERTTPGALLAGLLEEICDAVAAEPPTVCHRDFMVRNLVPVAPAGEGPEADGELAVLDHQDLRPGPPLYDLASLLNDSLFPDPALESELLAAAQPPGTGAEAFAASYHRTAVQRTLKAVGTYARSGHHGELIGPTLERALDHLERTPEGGRRADRLPGLRQSMLDLLE